MLETESVFGMGVFIDGLGWDDCEFVELAVLNLYKRYKYNFVCVCGTFQQNQFNFSTTN